MVAFECRITMWPENGRFPTTAYRDLLQHQITIPGLDTNWVHTLIDVTVNPLGQFAELTIHSEPMVPMTLDRTIRIVGSPPAQIRVLDVNGTELHTGPHTRPLRTGEPITINDQHYQVIHTAWPHRDPNSGTCAGAVDWQHIIAAPTPPPTYTPTLATE